MGEKQKTGVNGCRISKWFKAGPLFLLILLLSLPLQVSASNVRLSKTKKTMMAGKSYTLKIIGTTKKAKWSSSKSNVASVDSNGVVKGKQKGTTVITAKIGKKLFKCTVTITQPVTYIKLNKTSIVLKKGRTARLTATAKPKNSYDKKVIWSSSNESIAIVNAKGKVTAVSVGNAVITAKAADGRGAVARCLVSVKAEQKPMKITPAALNLTEGQFSVLTASGATGNVAWASSDHAVATVGYDGTVVAVGPGTAQIVAMNVNGTQYASCNVTVIQTQTQTSTSGSAQQFLKILQRYSGELSKKKAENKFVGYSNSANLNADTWNELLNLLDTRGITYNNCALMVRMALREMGKLGQTQTFWGNDGGMYFAPGVKETLLQSCVIMEVHQTPNQLLAKGELLPGDICSWHGMGHTNVYAGNGLWYDAGRGGDGSEMTIKQLKQAGVSAAVLKEDIAKDQNKPDLSSSIHIFNSFGPSSTINLDANQIAYIVRLVK